MVVAPALIPKRSGERIKTNRRDAVTLVRLHRAGELTGVWTPDAAHEAVRDLVRAREAATDDLRRKRQQLLSFLLRHSRIYSGGGHWTMAHRRWLANQKFEHAAQQIVFQEGIDAIEDAVQRLRRLEKQLVLIVPEWSMAPVVEAYQAMRGASFLVAPTIDKMAIHSLGAALSFKADDPVDAALQGAFLAAISLKFDLAAFVQAQTEALS